MYLMNLYFFCGSENELFYQNEICSILNALALLIKLSQYLGVYCYRTF